MLNCWQEDADDRPTFEDLRRELKRMENQHKVNSRKQTNKQILMNRQKATILETKFIHWCSPACGRLVRPGPSDYVINARKDVFAVTSILQYAVCPGLILS